MSGIARAQPQARAAHGEQQQLTQDDQRGASADRSLGAALDASLAMAQAALSVRGAAIAALLDEVAALRSENDVIAASITDPGLSALRQRLQYLEVGWLPCEAKDVSTLRPPETGCSASRVPAGAGSNFVTTPLPG
jgi:hypothetical protein